MPSVGFINPTLYYGGYNVTLPNTNIAIFNDVTFGENNCCKGIGSACCSAGFNATQGWDPASGWGSIDYSALAQLFGVAPSTIITSPVLIFSFWSDSACTIYAGEEGIMSGVCFEVYGSVGHYGIMTFPSEGSNWGIHTVYYSDAACTHTVSNNYTVIVSTSCTAMGTTGLYYTTAPASTIPSKFNTDGVYVGK